MPTQSIHFLFTYCYEDFHPPKEARATPRALFPWHLVVGWVLVIGAGIFAIMLFSTRPDKHPLPAPMNSARPDWPQISVAAIILGLFLYSYLRQRTGGKARWQEKYPQFPMAVTLSPDGILWEHSTSHTHQQWNTYQSFTEDGTKFSLTSPKGPSALLPKRIMSPEQINAVRALLEVAIHPAFGFPVQPNMNETAQTNRNIEAGKEN